MGWTLAGKQIRKLERQQAQLASSDRKDGYAFTLHPTCPPSTSVIFTGGWAWEVYGYLIEFGYHIPTYTIDTADSIKCPVYGMPAPTYGYFFTNAGWYVPVLFLIRSMSTPPEVWPDEPYDYLVYLYGRQEQDATPYVTEYETPAEAENAIRHVNGDRAATYGVVCGGLILKNDGNTTEPNSFEPIDAVNRGRSYIFDYKRYGWMMG